MMMSSLTRRGLLQRSSAAVLGLASPWPFLDAFNRWQPARPAMGKTIDSALLDPDLVQQLAMRALDAARSAGAQYADVRLTRTRRQDLQAWPHKGQSRINIDDEVLAVGVRAFVQGYWGFAASPYWAPEEVVRLAQDAVAQAHTNAVGTSRPVDLGTYPVTTGSWTMPVRIDPFRITVEDKCAFLSDLISTALQSVPRLSHEGGGVWFRAADVRYARQERVLATTEGTMITQTVFDTACSCTIDVYNSQAKDVGEAAASGVTRAGIGWEMFSEARVLEQLPALYAAAEEAAIRGRLPVKPVEVGRYDVVCDAATMTGVLDATLGRATQLDRALGYEANASGTSYLGPDPLACVGTPVASPLVNVTANRSLAGGLATVKWDDEGIVPQDFPLITQGTLVDYQTTREQAAWLAPWYQQQGKPVRSHGCAAAADASAVTMQMTPNLALTPSASGTTLEDLIAGTTKGIALLGGQTTADFQSRNGMIRAPGALMYEIRDGKLVSQITQGGVLFNSTELWKNVTALGGAASLEHAAMDETKGQPSQTTAHTVSAVPVALKNMAVIDLTRRV